MGSFRPFGLIIGILLSLFICPGTGHRYLGRTRAGKIVFWSFIVSFVIFAVALYGVVQDTVIQFQATGKKIDIANLEGHLREIILNAGGTVLALGVLLLIYFVAPVELVIHEIWRAAKGYPIEGAASTAPVAKPDLPPSGESTPPAST